jgi:predicted nicotinamide N-methyase
VSEELILSVAMTAETNSSPRLPETPLEAVAAVEREQVIVDDRTFLIERPAQSDKLLDHPALRAAFGPDGYMPYWADLWPAARMLAKWLVRQKWPASEQPLHALEVGCGLGLPGIAALAMGLHVTFSDYDATALRFAAGNARLNGFTHFETLQMDWRHPPEGLRFPVVLASDLIYELGNVAPLVALVKKVLAPTGVCLLTDQDRVPSHILRETLMAEGLPFTTTMLRAGEPGGRRLKGTLYRITQTGGADPLAEPPKASG